MPDLSTRYLGLTLKNPLVASSSPLTSHLDGLLRLEDAGAAAVVLPSLFEEELIVEQEAMHRFLDLQDIGHHESDTFLPELQDYRSRLDETLELIQAAKERLEIPVIASLNGIQEDGWIDYARDLQEAGCDALELNIYYVAADATESGGAVERRYLDLAHALRQQIRIPLAIKTSSQFSSFGHLLKGLEEIGIQGAVLFNRFYQPDLDLDSLKLVSRIAPSTAYEALLRIRWIGLLRHQTQLSLAATGGFHTAEDCLKALLVGADAVYLCSALLAHGPGHLGNLLISMRNWLETNEYDAVRQLQGSVCVPKAQNPALFARTNYVNVIDTHNPARGVRT